MKVSIIGGGVTGLVTAYKLSKKAKKLRNKIVLKAV